MKTHLDLCSGIGGFALAAQWAGYTTIGFCEIDPFCQKVLAKNFPEVPIHADLKTLDGRTVRGWAKARASLADADRQRRQQIADSTYGDEGTDGRRSKVNGHEFAGGIEGGNIALITAGYPCQPFSQAGKRLGEEDDRHLWPAIAALVADLQPDQCLFENVNGHVTLGLDRVLADLEALGYACGAVVVPACAVNAPHRRDRVWIMAHAGNNGPFYGSVSTQQAQFATCGSSGALAHATGGRGRRGGAPGETGLAALGGEVVVNANGANGKARSAHGVRTEPRRRPELAHPSRRKTLSALGYGHDGLSPRMARWDLTDEAMQVLRHADGTETLRDSHGVADGLSAQTVLRQCMLGKDAECPPSVERNGSETISVSLPGHPTVPSVRINVPSPPPSSELREARTDRVSLPSVSCEGRPTRRIAEGEGTEDVSGLQDGFLSLHPQSESNMLEGMSLGIGAAQRHEALASQRMTFGPDWEHGIPRTTDHEPDRVNKLKALGNAIVPAVAYEIIEAMKAA